MNATAPAHAPISRMVETTFKVESYWCAYVTDDGIWIKGGDRLAESDLPTFTTRNPDLDEYQPDSDGYYPKSYGWRHRAEITIAFVSKDKITNPVVTDYSRLFKTLQLDVAGLTFPFAIGVLKHHELSRVIEALDLDLTVAD